MINLMSLELYSLRKSLTRLGGRKSTTLNCAKSLKGSDELFIECLADLERERIKWKNYLLICNCENLCQLISILMCLFY